MLHIPHAHGRRLSWRPRRALKTLLTRYTRAVSRGDAGRLAGWMAAAALSLALVAVLARTRTPEPVQPAMMLPHPAASTAPAASSSGTSVIDPVCGRTLDPQRAVGFCRIEGQTFWFDRPSCQHAFTSEPLKYVQLRVVVRMAPDVAVTRESSPTRARRTPAPRTAPSAARPTTAAEPPPVSADTPPVYAEVSPSSPPRTAPAVVHGPLEAAPSVYEPFPTSAAGPVELEEVPAPVVAMPSGMRPQR